MFLQFGVLQHRQYYPPVPLLPVFNIVLKSYYPPASEASREVANLTEKNLHTPVFGVKEFVPKAVIFFWQSMETQNGNFTNGCK